MESTPTQGGVEQNLLHPKSGSSDGGRCSCDVGHSRRDASHTSVEGWLGKPSSLSRASGGSSRCPTAVGAACTPVKHATESCHAKRSTGPTVHLGSVTQKLASRRRRRGSYARSQARHLAEEPDSEKRCFFSRAFWAWLGKISIITVGFCRALCVRHMFTNTSGEFEWTLHKNSYLEGFSNPFYRAADDHLYDPDPWHDPLGDLRSWTNSQEQEDARVWHRNRRALLTFEAFLRWRRSSHWSVSAELHLLASSGFVTGCQHTPAWLGPS